MTTGQLTAIFAAGFLCQGIYYGLGLALGIQSRFERKMAVIYAATIPLVIWAGFSALGEGIFNLPADNVGVIMGALYLFWLVPMSDRIRRAIRQWRHARHHGPAFDESPANERA